MKISDILHEAQIKDFRDPDHEPGAVEREGKARAGLRVRQDTAVELLNPIITKYKLGQTLKVGDSPGLAGEFIQSDRKSGSGHGSFKTKSGNLESTLWFAGRYDDLCLTLDGLPSVSKQDLHKKMKEFMPKILYTTLYVTIEERFKTSTFHFGSASYFSEKENVTGLKKFLEYLKKEVEFAK